MEALLSDENMLRYVRPSSCSVIYTAYVPLSGMSRMLAVWSLISLIVLQFLKIVHNASQIHGKKTVH
jgi:hypothetical protein